MIAQSLVERAAADRVPQTARPALRVAMLSDRLWSPRHWSQRGMSVVRLAPAALERLLSNTPDAVVLDLASGGSHHVAACWRLRDLVQVPFVVLAEGASGTEVEAHFERGADDVVTEPPDDSLLAARVAAVLRRRLEPSSDRTPQTIRFSGADVDMTRRLVLRESGCQALSRTEFSVLEALLRAGGRACSHAELITRVWGAECASARHYLRLYVRYLRKKIEADPERPRNILNVRGMGYRLTVESTVESTEAPEPLVLASRHAAPAVGVPT